MDEIPRWIKIFLVAVVALSLIFLYLWQGWRVIYLQQRISELDEQLTPLRERKRQLLLDKARYFTYERVERIAKERLGMVEPEIKKKTGDEETGD